jgi:hypothetical protein
MLLRMKKGPGRVLFLSAVWREGLFPGSDH